MEQKSETRALPEHVTTGYAQGVRDTWLYFPVKK